MARNRVRLPRLRVGPSLSPRPRSDLAFVSYFLRKKRKARLAASAGPALPALPVGPTYAAVYDPSVLSSLWQDVAGTIPVTEAGQAVARVDDLSGAGRHLTQSTAGSRMTYQTDGSLHWLEGAAGKWYTVTDGVALSEPFSLLWAAERASSSTRDGIVWYADSLTYIGDNIDGATTAFPKYRITATTVTGNGAGTDAQDAHVSEVTRVGGTSTLRVNGDAAGTSVAPLNPFTITRVSGYGGGYDYVGPLYALVAVASDATDHLTEIREWAAARAGVEI